MPTDLEECLSRPGHGAIVGWREIPGERIKRRSEDTDGEKRLGTENRSGSGTGNFCDSFVMLCGRETAERSGGEGGKLLGSVPLG